MKKVQLIPRTFDSFDQSYAQQYAKNFGLEITDILHSGLCYGLIDEDYIAVLREAIQSVYSVEEIEDSDSQNEEE